MVACAIGIAVVARVADAEPRDARAARGEARRASVFTVTAPRASPGARPSSPRLAAAAPPIEIRAPRAIAPAIVGRVLDARFDTRILERSIAARTAREREAPWLAPPLVEPERREFRPRVMPTVMGFPTGGGGVKLKIRF